MTKITRDQVSALQIDAAAKTDLLSLFDDITKNETTITELRSKTPTDSQKVVESTDYAKYEAAVAELTELKKKFGDKLNNLPTDENEDDNSLPQVFRFF